MIPLLLSMVLSSQAPAVPEPVDVDEIVVSTVRPETVYCVRFYRESASRTPKFTCKTHVEWRAVKAARHDSRSRTAAKAMSRGFFFDTALQEEGVSASVRPRAR